MSDLKVWFVKLFWGNQRASDIFFKGQITLTFRNPELLLSILLNSACLISWKVLYSSSFYSRLSLIPLGPLRLHRIRSASCEISECVSCLFIFAFSCFWENSVVVFTNHLNDSTWLVGAMHFSEYLSSFTWLLLSLHLPVTGEEPCVIQGFSCVLLEENKV